MANSLPFIHPKPTDTQVAQRLQDVLTRTYSVYLATHNYHWNIEGVQFVALHGMLEQQYRALFLAIDEIAERIRALGSYAQPFDGENIIHALQSISNVLAKECDINVRADSMVENLIVLHESAVKSCQSAKDAANQIDDDETENLMVERVTAHQKTLWMLRSILK